MSSQPTFSDALNDVLDVEGAALTHADPSETVRPQLEQGDPAVIRGGLGPFTETLGMGGMGLVRTAEQRSLARTVAVKSLRMDAPSAAAVKHLLQEAHVTGLLDHPNVLPVHDILIDEAGHPHILMKRVEGEPWTAWVRDPERVKQTYDRDPLAWHLQTFLTVCNAVAYAHDRGILHRDLKGDNVMIGRFGEVLVLDWGIAVALDDRHGDRIPLARDQRRVAGTPRMMPPEMALGDGPAQGVHTDVYLLGALLYQVLTGRTPHRGNDVAEVLAGIPTSVPELPEGTPGELARIVRQAMAFDPADRFASASELRGAVQRFLDHRGSVRLAARAQRAARRVHDGIAAGVAEQAVLHAAHDEARFGFEQALAEWPENPVAREGLRDVRLALARWEVERGRPDVADALVEAVDEVPDDLVRAIEGARAAAARRERELEELRVDADPRVGQRTRVFIVGLLCVLWVIVPLVFGYFEEQLRWWHLFATTGSLTVLIAALGLWARESLSRTALNRATYFAAMMIPLSQLVIDLAAASYGASPQDMMVARPALWFVVVAMYAVTTVPRLWPAVVLSAVAAIISAAFPGWGYLAVTVSNAVLMAFLAWIWWNPELLVDPRKAPQT